MAGIRKPTQNNKLFSTGKRSVSAYPGNVTGYFILLKKPCHIFAFISYKKLSLLQQLCQTSSFW